MQFQIIDLRSLMAARQTRVDQRKARFRLRDAARANRIDQQTADMAFRRDRIAETAVMDAMADYLAGR